MVPPPSGSVSASLRSAFLCPFSPPPPPPPPLEFPLILPPPPASASSPQTGRRLLREPKHKHTSPSARVTSAARRRPRRHVAARRELRPVVTSRRRQSDRSIRSPAPVQSSPRQSWSWGPWGVSCDPGNSTASLARAIVIWAAVLGSLQAGAGKAPLLRGFRGTPRGHMFVTPALCAAAKFPLGLFAHGLPYPTLQRPKPGHPAMGLEGTV